MFWKGSVPQSFGEILNLLSAYPNPLVSRVSDSMNLTNCHLCLHRALHFSTFKETLVIVNCGRWSQVSMRCSFFHHAINCAQSSENLDQAGFVWFQVSRGVSETKIPRGSYITCKLSCFPDKIKTCIDQEFTEFSSGSKQISEEIFCRFQIHLQASPYAPFQISRIS